MAELDPNNPNPNPDSQQQTNTNFVTRDEYNSMKQDNEKLIQDLNRQNQEDRQMFQNTISEISFNSNPPPDLTPKMTSEEFLQKWQDGDVTPKDLDSYIQQNINSEVSKVAEELKTLKQQGTETLIEIAQMTATKDLDYYEEYKDEIDTLIKTFQPGLKTKPQSYQMAHDIVVGRHTKDIVKKAKEEALRAQNEPGADVTLNKSPGSGRTAQDGKLDLSLDNVFTEAGGRLGFIPWVD